MLKEGVERVIEKMEIISNVTSKNRKFESKAEERLDRLEAAQLLNVQKKQFHSDMEKMEQRIHAFIHDALTKLHENMKEHKDYLDESCNKFQK